MLKNRILCFWLLCCSILSYSQNSVGIYNHTIAVSPGYTVANNTTITVTGMVENKGGTNINNNVHVHLAVDTSTTSVPKYYLRITRTYSMSNFLAGQTFTFSLVDVASANNAYKVAGNGSTIVVWATVGPPTASITTSDSAYNNVTIIGIPQGINELLHFEENPIYFKNPITETIQLNYDETVYTKTELNDINGKHISVLHDKLLNIDNLPKGLYLLRFWHDKQKTYVTKKIIIE